MVTEEAVEREPRNVDERDVDIFDDGNGDGDLTKARQ